MFDIGFWEISLIAAIALIVVGPEKFPGLIRNVGYWLGRAREMASNLKAEIDMEVEKAEKLKELANEQLELQEEHEKIAAGEKESTLQAKPVGTRFVTQEHTQVKSKENTEAEGKNHGPDTQKSINSARRNQG